MENAQGKKAGYQFMLCPRSPHRDHIDMWSSVSQLLWVLGFLSVKWSSWIICSLKVPSSSKTLWFKAVMIKSALITACNFVFAVVSYNARTNLCLAEFCSKGHAAFSTDAALITCLRTNPWPAYYVNVKWKAEAALNLICCWKKQVQSYVPKQPDSLDSILQKTLR